MGHHRQYQITRKDRDNAQNCAYAKRLEKNGRLPMNLKVAIPLHTCPNPKKSAGTRTAVIIPAQLYSYRVLLK